METRERQLKALPQCATKSELMDWYLASNYSADTIRKGINEIIADNRKLPLVKAKFVKNIRPKELAIFVREFDLPVGFTL